MLSRLQLAKHSVNGISIGGVYTSLLIPEVDSIFDVGIAPRSFVGAKNLFISHGHADHIGAFQTMVGIRGLSRVSPPKVFLPAELHRDFSEGVNAFNRGQHRPLKFDYCPLRPGDEVELYGDLKVRAFRTKHTIPSLGYQLFRRVPKLKADYAQLPGAEIGALRKSGAPIFDQIERTEIVYATDTLIDVLEENPELLKTAVLILECTFLDERKNRRETRRKCHVHLDEIIERADLLQQAEEIVLMHFSQLYSPGEIRHLLNQKVPPELFKKIRPLLPERGPWPG